MIFRETPDRQTATQPEKSEFLFPSRAAGPSGSALRLIDSVNFNMVSAQRCWQLRGTAGRNSAGGRGCIWVSEAKCRGTAPAVHLGGGEDKMRLLLGCREIVT